MIIEYMNKINKIDKIINPFYETLLHPEMMELKLA